MNPESAAPGGTDFLDRRRVVLLDGASEGGSLTDHLVDVRAQFESRGLETVVIDLKLAASNAELIAQIQSGRVRFCYGLSGFGSDLSVTHAHGTANFWNFARTPYVGAMPDSPVFIPARHRLSSDFILFLYTDPIHLEIATAIGSPSTRRALVGQSGLAPPSRPCRSRRATSRSCTPRPAAIPRPSVRPGPCTSAINAPSSRTSSPPVAGRPIRRSGTSPATSPAGA